MPSVTELAVRCDHIGTELSRQDLSLYDLVDRATALACVARTLEGLMEREHQALAPGRDSVQQDIVAARAVLRDAATAVESGHQEELRDRLLAAQIHLLAGCRVLTA